MKQALLVLIVCLVSCPISGETLAQKRSIPAVGQLPPANQNDKISRTARSLAPFLRIKPKMSMKQVVETCGLPDKDIGSGIHIFIYELEDGSEVWIGTPDAKKILYVTHVFKTGKKRDIIRKT